MRTKQPHKMETRAKKTKKERKRNGERSDIKEEYGRSRLTKKSALILDLILMAQGNRMPNQFLTCFTASPMTGMVTVLQKYNRWSDLLIGFKKVAEMLSEQRSISKE